MHSKFEYFIASIINTLDSKPELVKVFIIPFLLFLVDLCLRAVIHVDIVDAGADMAFLATASFITVLVEDGRNSRVKPFVKVVFFLFFMLPWVFCLWGISNTNPFYTLNIDNHTIDVHFIVFILSWIVGLSSLIISSAFINQLEIIQSHSFS
jgi:hypothetical protein